MNRISYITGSFTTRGLVRVLSVHRSRTAARRMRTRLDTNVPGDDAVFVFPVDEGPFGPHRSPRVGDELAYFARNDSVVAPLWSRRG